MNPPMFISGFVSIALWVSSGILTFGPEKNVGTHDHPHWIITPEWKSAVIIAWIALFFALLTVLFSHMTIKARSYS